MLARLLSRRFCSNLLPDFLALSEQAIEGLQQRLDQLEEQGRNIEYSCKDGVLKVSVGSNRIVVNRQIPNQQIWYSSLRSGPQRFNYSEKRWVNARGESLPEVLERDILAQ